MSPEQVARVLDLVRERMGLEASEGRRAHTEGEVRAAHAASGLPPEAYIARLAVGGRTFDELAERLTIGETYFFREPAQFDLLREHLLPEIRARRGPAPPIRAWVAACSSGEEAWSLAMLARDMGEAVQILATDLSARAIALAREGRYGAWSLRHEGARRAARWLRADGPRWVVDSSLARAVTFQRLNLAAADWPSVRTRTTGLDLVLCRNVLLYFDPATVAQVAERLYGALAPGGWLLTASSDPRLDGHAAFEVSSTAAGLVYRRACTPAVEERPVAVPEPTAPPTGEAPIPVPRAAAPAPTTADVAQRIHVLANEAGSEAALARVDELVRGAPLVPAHHFLAGVLLLDLGRAAEAAAALQRALYLDPTLIIARFLLGTAHARLGQAARATGAWREVRERCARHPAAEVLPLADGATAGQLGHAADALLARARGTG